LERAKRSDEKNNIRKPVMNQAVIERRDQTKLGLLDVLLDILLDDLADARPVGALLH
jgi:hypothetical protein